MKTLSSIPFEQKEDVFFAFFSFSKKGGIIPPSPPQTVDKKLFSPRRGRIALSANERIAEFLDFAIQARFAYVNKL